MAVKSTKSTRRGRQRPAPATRHQGQRTRVPQEASNPQANQQPTNEQGPPGPPSRAQRESASAEQPQRSSAKAKAI
eukprot:3428832-Alexandrium_andersonii.AAC.1